MLCRRVQTQHSAPRPITRDPTHREKEASTTITRGELRPPPTHTCCQITTHLNDALRVHTRGAALRGSARCGFGKVAIGRCSACAPIPVVAARVVFWEGRKGRVWSKNRVRNRPKAACARQEMRGGALVLRQGEQEDGGNWRHCHACLQKQHAKVRKATNPPTPHPPTNGSPGSHRVRRYKADLADSTVAFGTGNQSLGCGVGGGPWRRCRVRGHTGAP